MTFCSVVLTSLHFWTLLAGLLLGFAAAHATVLPARSADPARTRKRKPTKIFISLSGAVASATIGVFLSDVKGLPEQSIYWTLGASFFAGALGLRFKKAAGIPLFCFFGTSYFLFYLLYRPWDPVRGVVEVASVKVLGQTRESTLLTITNTCVKEKFLDVPAGAIRFGVDFLKASPVYEILGRKASYKAVRLLDAGEKQVVPLDDAVPGFSAAAIERLPGFELVRLDLVLEKPKLFSSYGLTVDENGNFLMKEK